MAKKPQKIQFEALDPSISEEALKSLGKDPESYDNPLVKSLVSVLDNRTKVQRLSFEQDPQQPSKYSGLYYDKWTLLPDNILKRLAIIDSLVGAILRVRAKQVTPFGKPLENRFGYGYRLEPKKSGEFQKLSTEKREELLAKVNRVSKLLATCGATEKLDLDEQMSLSKFFQMSARNACLFGRFATEIISFLNPKTGKEEPYAFRPVDAGTIYKAIPHSDAVANLRKQALAALSRIKNEKIKVQGFENDEYAWVQVINGTPQQAFSNKEMVVYNCYPVTDIELNGYPLTPLDTAIADVVTHINITNHNKLYFQMGRASKGMLVISSDDIDQSTLHDLKQQFNAAINNVANSWRMPVFKVNKDDNVEWKPIDSSGRDMEFQYLSDNNARIILSAFQMSPDEIPGYAHLSKGTNNQALSESSNEYKLEAARDAGIRPLLSDFQDFINTSIMPLFDAEVAKYFDFRLQGLDADTAEKERTGLVEDMPNHGTYDEMRAKVEKAPLGKEWGGEFPFNSVVQATLDKYFTVGQIKEHFFGVQDASKDPRWDYCRDPFYFQNIQLVLQKQQMDQQQQMAQQQIEAQQQQEQNPQNDSQPQEANDGSKGELDQGVDKLISLLSKSDKELDTARKALNKKHNEIVKKIMDSWEEDTEVLSAELAELVNKNKK